MKLTDDIISLIMIVSMKTFFGLIITHQWRDQKDGLIYCLLLLMAIRFSAWYGTAALHVKSWEKRISRSFWYFSSKQREKLLLVCTTYNFILKCLFFGYMNLCLLLFVFVFDIMYFSFVTETCIPVSAVRYICN